jgi:hypothetical protein
VKSDARYAADILSVGQVGGVMEAAIAFVTCLVCILVLIPVHELGHYLAGWAAGFPRQEMRIRLLTFPQYVALRQGGAWVSPNNHSAYYAAMRRHLTTPGHLFVYTAGGFLLETAVVAAVGIAALLVGYPRMAILVVGMSLSINIVYGFFAESCGWFWPT